LWLSGRNFGTGSATDAITQSDTTVAETPISVKLARIDDTWIFGSLAWAEPYFFFHPGVNAGYRAKLVAFAKIGEGAVVGKRRLWLGVDTRNPTRYFIRL